MLRRSPLNWLATEVITLERGTGASYFPARTKAPVLALITPIPLASD